MKQEFFTARLLQIQLEMEAVKSEIAGMQSRNAWRECNGGGEPDFGIFDFKVNADKLRSLQGDIKALMEEYSKGEELPAVDPFKAMKEQSDIECRKMHEEFFDKIKAIWQEALPAAAETKPRTLASAMRIIGELGPVKLFASHGVNGARNLAYSGQVGWSDIEKGRIALINAALQVLLRPAAGDNERLYTSKELHRIVSEAIITFKDREVSTGEFVDFMKSLEGAGE